MLRRRSREAAPVVSAVRTDRCSERVDAVLDAARKSCAPVRMGQVPGLFEFEAVEVWPVLGLEWPGEGEGEDVLASESRTRLRPYEDGALESSEGM